ncbi:1a95a104-0c85-47c2-bc46-c99235d60061 [Sclerotinia trifoliorum]|uniref:1a95a104-0c85-47c2-bc46-c99235d60061 n=1 Tax=Sclerotinia trifoliorum TaxID=28548 RepID=A0A8H2VZJ4_9HELO|nr:1a95a104-0c85-47c2-bc46-c99235d60061 [Sclerotinia trifoliorum]
MEGSASRIATLSDIIASNTAKLDKYLQTNKISQPSLDENCLDSLNLPRDIYEARAAIVDATLELRLICLGPRETWYSRRAYELASLYFVSSFDVPSLVPISGSATFAEIASRCQSPVSKEIVKRLLRHSMTGGVFKEHENEVVSHTASSRLMVEESNIRDWVKLEADGV